MVLLDTAASIVPHRSATTLKTIASCKVREIRNTRYESPAVFVPKLSAGLQTSKDPGWSKLLHVKPTSPSFRTAS